MTSKRDLSDMRARRGRVDDTRAIRHEHIIMLGAPDCPRCGSRLYVASTQGKLRYMKCRPDKGGCGLTGKLVAPHGAVKGTLTVSDTGANQ